MAVYAIGEAEYEIPDNVQGDQLTQVLTQLASQHAPQAAQTNTATQAQPDRLQQASDALRGFRDIPQAGSQMMMHALPESVVAKGNELIGKANQLPVIGPVTQAMGIVPETPQQYDQSIQAEEQQYQQRRAQAGETGLDGTRLAGNVIATAPVQALLPGSTGALLPAMGKAAVQGGVLGALNPVTDGGENFGIEKGKQAAIGAATGGLLTPLARGFARVLNPQTSKQVQTLLDEGITPTPGQVLGGMAKTVEDKATSIPLLGDAIKAGQRRAINQFNQAAYRRALDPVGKNTPEIGREGIGAVRKALNESYDELLPKIQFKPDAEFVADIAKIEQMAGELPEQQAKQFQKIVGSKLQSRMTPQGNMSGETLKGVESELTNLAKGYKTDTSFDNRQLGDALGEVLASVRRTVERVNPDHAQELKAVNLGWANYARLRRAASGLGAEDGIFTPAQLQNAVKAEAGRGSKSAFSEGSALMQDLSEAGKNVLSSKVPDSGTAGRLATSGALLGAGSIALPVVAKGALLAGVPALGYTPLGQRLFAQAATARPDSLRQAGQALFNATPLLSAGGGAAANPLLNSR